MKRELYKPRPLAPLELPGIGNTRSKELASLREALDREHYPDEGDGYPPHDEETFQEGYPHRGMGGYGSPREF